MIEYDPKLVEFTEKLTALMEEYDAQFEVLEETVNWETRACGLAIEVKDSGENISRLEIDTRPPRYLTVYANDVAEVVENMDKIKAWYTVYRI